MYDLPTNPCYNVYPMISVAPYPYRLMYGVDLEYINRERNVSMAAAIRDTIALPKPVLLEFDGDPKKYISFY